MRCRRIAARSSPRCAMSAKLADVLAFLRTQLEAGRQAYVIYPLIEESDKLDVKAAAEEFEVWRRTAAAVSLRSVARPDSGAGEAGDHGALSPRRNERADQHDGDRGGRGRSERHRHAGGKRGAFRAGAAASIARADRPRRAQVVLHSLERRRKRWRRARSWPCWKKRATVSRWRKRIGISAGRAICWARRRADCRR